MTDLGTDLAAQRMATECLRVPPFGESCTLGRNHKGRCNWYTATPADLDAQRLRLGETCQVGQPTACGDFHNAGQCVRRDLAAGDE